MEYTMKILDNDLNIVLNPIENSQTIAVGFFIKAGSRNETDENSGIAHFLEHMMFKGTENRSTDKLLHELDFIGASYNAATTTQITYYYVYGNADDTKKILDIVLDIYVNTVFDDKEMKKEKQVIVEEMRMRYDNPVVNLYSAVHQKIFAHTSLARDVVGTIETLMNINKKDLINFRTALYKPENTIFVISGNFNPTPILKMVSPILSELKNSGKVPHTYFNEQTIIFRNMAEQTEPYVSLEKNISLQQVYALIIFPLFDMYSYSNHEIDLLSYLLSNGLSGRLSKALREKNGITYSSIAYPVSYIDCGIYVIQMVVNPASLGRAVDIIFSELAKLKQQLITDEEMEKVINIAKNETIFSLVSPLDMMRFLGLNFIYDRAFKPDLNKEILEFKKVTKEQIKEISNKIFVKNKTNIFLYGNTTETKFNFNDL